MKYIVLTSQSTFELEKVVNEHIKHGWIPTGGVTVRQQHPYFYYQAMIKQPTD